MEEPSAVQKLCDIGLADELIRNNNVTRSPLALAAVIGNIDVCCILLLHSYNVYFAQSPIHHPDEYLIHQQQPRPLEVQMLRNLQQEQCRTQFEYVMLSTSLPSDIVQLLLSFIQLPPLNICLDDRQNRLDYYCSE